MVYESAAIPASEQVQSKQQVSNAAAVSVGRDPEASLVALAARLFLGTSPAKIVAVTSCSPSEGVTYVSRALHSFLTHSMGFSADLLTSAESLSRAPMGFDSPGIRDLASHSPNLQEPRTAPGIELGLAPSERLQAAIRNSKVVLVDCPPVASSADVLRLAPHVDGVLLIVEDGQRTRAELQRTVSTIEAAQGRIFGVVLNKRRYILPDWLYRLLH